MAGADMKSKSNDRLTAAVVLQVEAKKAEKDKAKGRLPAMGAYLAINNPNSNQQRDQITLLTNAALETLKGVA